MLIICILNIKENIQKSNLYYFLEKEVSNADYFEVFIYQIYKIKGYNFVKEIILKLISNNFESILINESLNEHLKKYYEKHLKNSNLLSHDIFMFGNDILYEEYDGIEHFVWEKNT